MRRASIVLVAVLLLGACGTRQPGPAGGHPAPMPPVAGASAAVGSSGGAATAGSLGGVGTADKLGPGARHNEADVEFVRRLISHHRVGIALAGAAAAKEPKARTLAQAIIVTQQDEIV